MNSEKEFDEEERQTFMSAVEEGLKDLEEGRVISLAQAKERLEDAALLAIAKSRSKEIPLKVSLKDI